MAVALNASLSKDRQAVVRAADEAAPDRTGKPSAKKRSR
jgi:hypothetical protein